MAKTYKPRKYVKKARATALTKTVNQVVKKAIAHKKCHKMWSSHQTNGDLNFPTNSHQYNQDIGRIGKYNPTILLDQGGNLSQARVSNKIFLDKIYIKFATWNKSAYNLLYRVYIFKNSNENEVFNLTGANLCQSYNGQPVSYSTDYLIGQSLSFNYNLVEKRSDLIMDKTFELPYDQTGSSSHVIPYRRHHVFKKSIKRYLEYEARSDNTGGSNTDYKGSKYYIFWHIITPTATSNVSEIEVDVMLDQCYSEDA